MRSEEILVLYCLVKPTHEIIFHTERQPFLLGMYTDVFGDEEPYCSQLKW